ncbi:MAG: adenylosuccinate lyase [Chitinophagaceae bacterium]|nr:adenylosuccinate lyase [Chitinophagaceae bacterium]
MELTPLTAISPIDGRYREQVSPLAPYFSEWGLIHYRVRVEIAYFLFLADQKLFVLPAAVRKHLQQMEANFGPAEAAAIKDIERTTRHDVKAVEYFLKEELKKAGGEHLQEWIHFGLTSQDINHTAVPMSWQAALTDVYIPAMNQLQKLMLQQARKWKDVPMLAKTHGQPASPTRLGKEWKVFHERISTQLHLLTSLPHTGKFGGATGNFNAHQVSFPEKNWPRLADKFVQRLGLTRQQFTTQIEHYDLLAAHLDTIKRINTILIDFNRDCWTYISMEYFRQQTKAGEVGSSAMPHKVNPIDFENAEGNLGIANALLEHLSAKLPISRLQRDLTDSTVLRNIGVPLAHSLLAIQSMMKGMNKLLLNREKIEYDLNQNWAVVAEAIQTILRREQYAGAYEALKELTRGKEGITQKTLHTFIKRLPVKAGVKKELLSITPMNYTGVNPSF